MIKIPLTRGMFALIDDEDLELVAKFKWRAVNGYSTWYAKSTVWDKERNKYFSIWMHRLILNPSDEKIIDHIDKNGLNNQRSNIRICSHSQNSMNMRKRRNSISQYKGVFLDRRNKKWRAVIAVRGKSICLGSHESDIDAAFAYDQAAVEHFGSFANINFPGIPHVI